MVIKLGRGVYDAYRGCHRKGELHKINHVVSQEMFVFQTWPQANSWQLRVH